MRLFLPFFLRTGVLFLRVFGQDAVPVAFGRALSADGGRAVSTVSGLFFRCRMFVLKAAAS